MGPRKRQSLHVIQYNYDSNIDRSTLENLIRAFRGIQKLPPTDPNSFYALAGWHGEPFRGPGKNQTGGAYGLWWGGYCNHGNVLFPTWHRAYCLRFEQALQSIDGCEDVMLPYWDECIDMFNFEKPDIPSEVIGPINPVPIGSVIPSVLTNPKFPLDGEDWNPLYSYKLAKDTSFARNTPWNAKAEDNNTRYSKPKGYETVRFPKAGLVGTEKDRKFTDEWNKNFSDTDRNAQILNDNVSTWLAGRPEFVDEHGTPSPDTYSIYARYRLCLNAPNYTVFSNTTSQNQWIKDSDDPNERHGVVSLESPHNAIHLALGGFYDPGPKGYNANPKEYQFANGDMGDNETAGFDPIFFLHHCFIDYVFWCWQRKNKQTKRGSLEILYDYEGTVTDSAGSPVGLPPGTILDLDTPLMPFRTAEGDRYYTSNDMTNINNLGYTYTKGSLDKLIELDFTSHTPWMIGFDKTTEIDPSIAKWKHVHGINRAEVEGSFVVRTWAKSKDGKTRIAVGREAILSRLNVRGCKNCQTHLEVESFVPVYNATVSNLGLDSVDDVSYDIEVQDHKSTKLYSIDANTLGPAKFQTSLIAEIGGLQLTDKDEVEKQAERNGPIMGDL